MGPPSLQDRKRQVARDHIESTAMALFAERGYEQTTVEDIARAAGISGRTFFRYFATKEDVVYADHEVELERFRAALRDGPHAGGLPSRVARALAATHHVESDPMREARRAISATVPSVQDRGARLEREYEAALVEHVLETDPAADPVEATIAAGAIFGGLMTMPRVLTGGLTSDSPLELAQRVCALLERGLR